jgi:hypothetical protein
VVLDVYHPVTGLEIDYEHVCRTCANYSMRTRRKVKIIGCKLAPEHDGKDFGQQRDAFLACVRWVEREKPRPS